MTRRAFTLIELLVVASIIVLLVAILLPSLARSKYVTRSTLCLSNKRQVIVGLLNYAADHQTRLPNWAGDGNQYWMQDMPGVIFTVTRDAYNVPLEMWSCPVGSTPQLPYKWGGYGPVYKWKSNGMTWWVIRGSVGNDSKVLPNRELVSDMLTRQESGAVIMADSITGGSAAAGPTASYHLYQGAIQEAGIVRSDGSSQLVPLSDMLIRCPSEGWGNWWY
ncbi:MAG: prepilin-type N-terminal cleavage/methylation domain-containing protein [Planctomycetes bacterium]|nr:prepilin-type N-terminal cleavage/methylation domain-containing protein [Planctomycetota bacterium]